METLTPYSMMLEDRDTIQFIKVYAINPAQALEKAIEKAGMKEPTKILPKYFFELLYPNH